MNLTEYSAQTQTPEFVDLGILAINALDEGSGIITPANRIQRPMDGPNWRAHNNIFGETSSVGVIEERFDYDSNYKLIFKFGRK